VFRIATFFSQPPLYVSQVPYCVTQNLQGRAPWLVFQCLYHPASHSRVVSCLQVWENCPAGSGAAAREENAVVCCSMLGGLTASKCTCAVMGFAEPELLGFIQHWSAHCSSEPMWDSYRLACHHTGAPMMRSRVCFWCRFEVWLNRK